MEKKFNIKTIIIIICGILAVVFAGLTLLGKVTVDLAIAVVGITQVISGLIQMQIAKKAKSEEVGMEAYKAAKFTLILGAVFLALMAVKIIFIAINL